MRTRIANWNASIIYLAGRVSFLLTLSTYAMNIKKHMPTARKINPKIIWVGTKEARKLSLASWGKVQNAKCEDGPGLQRLYLMNKDFYIKFYWNIIHSSNSLWVNIIQSKYKLHDVRVDNIKAPTSSSVMWPYICEK